mmetsp:Transcript_7977/g.20615  ORF Transcript_7977/g.20615 Transcript_7977/m.20615 type:complete len:214 (+) Transcript_7977:1084-1725(+)
MALALAARGVNTSRIRPIAEFSESELPVVVPPQPSCAEPGSSVSRGKSSMALNTVSSSFTPSFMGFTSKRLPSGSAWVIALAMPFAFTSALALAFGGAFPLDFAFGGGGAPGPFALDGALGGGGRGNAPAGLGGGPGGLALPAFGGAAALHVGPGPMTSLVVAGGGVLAACATAAAAASTAAFCSTPTQKRCSSALEASTPIGLPVLLAKRLL